MEGLRYSLAKNEIRDARDIMIDFEQHFDDGAAAGESEEEICRKLGDVDELVKQYISDDTDAAGTADAAKSDDTEKTVFDEKPAENDKESSGKTVLAEEPPYGGQTADAAGQKSPNAPDTAGIIVILCLDAFVFSWAIPTLIGLIFGLMGTTIGIAVSGIAIFFSGIFGFFFDVAAMVSTGFAPLSLLFLGITLMAFGGMLVIASIASVKGFINLCIAIINQHSKVFTGRNILNYIGKKKKEAAAQ